MKAKIHSRHKMHENSLKNLKPFKPGFNPKRNAGPKNHELADFTINFKNALAKKVPAEKFSDILAKYILNGRPWAMQLGLEYLVEKPAQKHEGDIALRVKMSIRDLQKSIKANENGA